MWTSRSLFALTPQKLLAETRALLAARAENTAALLEHLAEIDERKLYVPAAYPSLQAFCVGELGVAENSAEKKIQAVRAVRRFPALLAAIAEGRLSVSAVNLLSAHLTPENADELIALASRRTCSAIRGLLVARERGSEPTVDLLAQVVANTRSEPDSNQVMSSACQPTPSPSECTTAPASPAPASPAPAARVLQFTVPAELAAAYRDALALAPYEVAHDPAQAFAHMLAAWREQLLRRRCGASRRPGRARARGEGHRVPAAVRRAVWERDGGRCTFTSAAGRRCECRDQLELDHVVPVARGGRSSVDNLRLRCRQHNQLAAEQVFGAAFMHGRREQAQRQAAAARAAREQVATQARAAREQAATQARVTRELAAAQAHAAREQAATQARAAREQAAGEARTAREQAAGEARTAREQAAAARAAREQAAAQAHAAREQATAERRQQDELVPWLRRLGFGAAAARQAAAGCAALADRPLEARVKHELALLAPPHTHVRPAAHGAT